jgi:hypothetical protein
MGAANIQRLRSDKRRPETVATQAAVGALPSRPARAVEAGISWAAWPQPFHGWINQTHTGGPHFDAIYFHGLTLKLRGCLVRGVKV